MQITPEESHVKATPIRSTCASLPEGQKTLVDAKNAVGHITLAAKATLLRK